MLELLSNILSKYPYLTDIYISPYRIACEGCGQKQEPSVVFDQLRLSATTVGCTNSIIGIEELRLPACRLNSCMQ